MSSMAARFSTNRNSVNFGKARTIESRNGKDVDVYLINPSDPKTDHSLLQLEGGGWGALDFSPDDKRLLVLEDISANESYLWLADARTGEKTLITPKGGAVLEGRARAIHDDRQGLGVSPARLR